MSAKRMAEEFRVDINNFACTKNEDFVARECSRQTGRLKGFDLVTVHKTVGSSNFEVKSTFLEDIWYCLRNFGDTVRAGQI